MINRTKKGFHAETWTDASAELFKANQNFVLVTLLGSSGSTPRASGTKMVVTEDDIFDTVGGGHLEFKIIEKARCLLQINEDKTQESKVDKQRIEHFPLGAALGQCCGGSVSVLFELLECLKTPIDIYGAGHVAHALVAILSQLPVQIRWIDSRQELFPESIPNNVVCISDDYPEDQVKKAPANSAFIVLTHNHQLDFSLCEAVIKRNDARFLGVIGSDTKAKRFRLRLQHKGFTEFEIDKMKCPIGLAEVGGKLPMEVAVSISAEIINLYQTDKEKTNKERNKQEQSEQSAPEKSIRDGLQWRELKQELPVLTAKETTDV